jgi:DNA mismatch repair ATPase MutS
MSETAMILNKATPRSLIIMDEVGRGTSTKDGCALSLSIIDYISTKNKSICVFASHFHELVSQIKSKDIKGVVFLKARISHEMNTLRCLYKIEPGVMDESHGIQVAKYAGLPQNVIDNAKRYYSEFY